MEAGAGIEPAVELLQSSALPLGDPAAIAERMYAASEFSRQDGLLYEGGKEGSLRRIRQGARSRIG